MIIVTECNKRLLATQIKFKVITDDNKDVTPLVNERTFYSKKSFKNFVEKGDGFFATKPTFADNCKYTKSLKITLNDIKYKWWNFTNSSFINHLSFLWHWKNFFFCLRYPFWKSRNVYTGEFLGYSCTRYNDIPEGWRKAFGKQLSKDLKKALKKDRCRKVFRWDQIKEKYGTLRLYASNYGEETEYILDKYELLSNAYCVNCGKEARYISRKGWIEIYCEKCFDKFSKKLIDSKDDYKKKCRLTTNDIPQLTQYDYPVIVTEYYNTEEECEAKYNEVEDDPKYRYRMYQNDDNSWSLEKALIDKKDIDIKEKYGIDLEKYWGLN